MQLLYIYFKQLNGIFDQDLNFGGEFLFNYDRSKKTLNINRNPFYIEGFYNTSDDQEGIAKVLNVTALIADNGAGKTSILNFIRNNLSIGCGGISESIIFIYKNQEKKIIYHFEDIEIVNYDFVHYGFEIKKIKPNRNVVHSDKANIPDFNYSTPPKITDFEKTDFIFFSNIFDGYFTTEVRGTYDISTNYLLRHDIIEDIEHKRISGDRRHNEIETFISHDIARQITFINEFSDKTLIPFELPELLFVSTIREYSEILTCFDSNDIQILKEYNLYLLVNHIFISSKFHTETNNDWKNVAEIYFITACIVNFLYELATDYRQIKKFFTFELSEKDFDGEIDIRTAVIQLLNKMEKQAGNFSGDVRDNLYSWISGVREFIEDVPNFINQDLVVNNSGTSFCIDISKNPVDFTSFYNLYKNSFQRKNYLNFGWRQMSTGEIAFLNIFSRFHAVANRQNKIDQSSAAQSLIVLIDEGEAHLHPNWQKKFIKLLLDFLPVIFKDFQGAKRSIQLILATNSAIPASDLPNSNIIFLEKENGRVIVRNSLEDKKKTFGANINTLLADSFFLREGTIGDFAKSKINHIIELLQDNYEEILSNKEYLEKSINLIGEPLIKNKLVQMLADRLTLNLININDRIEFLEKELKELKKKK